MKKSTRVLHDKPKETAARRVGHDPVIAIRLGSDLLTRIEKWGEAQQPPLSRSEAIRALAEIALTRKSVKAGKG